MSADPDAAGTRNLRALVSIMGAVAAPPALVVALAYYFAVGWHLRLADRTRQIYPRVARGVKAARRRQAA